MKDQAMNSETPLKMELQAMGQHFKIVMKEYFSGQIERLDSRDKRRLGLMASKQVTLEKAAEARGKIEDALYKDLLKFMLEIG